MRILFLTTAVSLALFAATNARADQPTASAASPVLKAAFDEVPQRNVRQRVTFSKRPARVSDEVEQTMVVEMRMATTLRQGNQIGDKSRTTAHNQQRRVVKTTHVESDRAVGVRVQYLEATKQLSATEGAPSPGQAAGNASEFVQPVAGKSYFCRRQPGKEGKLEITDAAGNIPPADEYEIVAQHMEMVGRQNPLAEVLAGNSVVVGQTISVPPSVAGKIFNLGEHFGEVTRFELTLEKIELHETATEAAFIARVEATSNNASQMRLQLEGPITVQVDTCRAVKVDLSGPIAMSETRGSYSTSYQMIGTGQLKMSAASAYRDAKR
jgi:hypothetical protein